MLEHGKYFDVVPLTNDDRLYLWACVTRSKRRPVMGQCWLNARQTLVLGDLEKRLTYVEGFASRCPLHHGWLLLDGAKVVDLTLRYRAAGVRLHVPPSLEDLGAPDGNEPGPYFGVTFPREYVEASRWQATFGLADCGPRYRPETLREAWRP